jgi:hypothetical protein
MNTIDGIRFVSDDELAAVVGGMMNNGQGDFLQTPKNTGGPSGGSFWGRFFEGCRDSRRGCPCHCSRPLGRRLTARVFSAQEARGFGPAPVVQREYVRYQTA